MRSSAGGAEPGAASDGAGQVPAGSWTPVPAKVSATSPVKSQEERNRCWDVASPEPAVVLRLEKVRLLWQYASKEVDAHRQRYLQLFAVFVTVGLASVASIVLERVAAVPGALIALATFGVASYAYVRVLMLPGQLEGAASTALHAIDRLIAAEDE